MPIRAGAKEIMAHPFFESVDWKTLNTKSIPPFVPRPTDVDDTSYFQGSFHRFIVSSFHRFIVSSFHRFIVSSLIHF